MPAMNRWGRMAEEHLKTTNPAEYQAMKAAGTLQEHLLAKQEEANELWTDALAQLNRTMPPKTGMAHLAREHQRHATADETVIETLFPSR